MMVTRRLLRTVVLSLTGIVFTASIAQVSIRALATPPAAASSQSHILVTIHELHGTGPDGNTHRLYRNDQGYVTTLNALGRIGSQVNGSELPDGPYHTLRVRLADEYKIIQPDGGYQTGHFSQQGKPTTVRVRGMVLVTNGNATAMQMLEKPHRSISPGGYYSDDDDD